MAHRHAAVIGVLSSALLAALASYVPPHSEEPDPGPFPFEIVAGSASMGTDAIGTPTVSLTIRNTSATTLSETNVKAEMYREGEKLEQYSAGDTAINLSTTDDVAAGQEHAGEWALYGWDGATMVVLSLADAKDVSGTSFYCSARYNDGCQRQAICAAGETVCELPAGE